jgi:nucleoid DNA-binding protein
MKIGKYISELLYDHDSVILPGFGEFYTKYNPARFVQEEGRIEAPSKTIAYNADKKHGDTPLVAHLCEQQHMHEEQVSKYLTDYVTEIFELMANGNKVELEKIGIFSFDQDGSVNFDPDNTVNYLDETSGLGAVSAPPHKSPEQPPLADEPETKPIKDTYPVEEPAPADIDKSETHYNHEDYIMEQEQKRTLPPALKWIAFTVVPLLVIIIILAINYQYFFSCSRQPKDPETTVVTIGEPSSEEVPDPQAASQEPTAEALSQTQQPQTTVDPEVEPPKPEPGRKVYYIVVGSFPDEATAKELALDLRKKGASLASLFMTTGFNYHRVCYGYYYDLTEAEALLDSVKEQVNSDAYILHR